MMTDNHFAGDGKKDTMSLSLALIVLDRLNTTERIDFDREELSKAVRVVSEAAKYRIPQKPDTHNSCWAALKIKKCPACKYEISYGGSPRFCSHCGQAINWK